MGEDALKFSPLADLETLHGLLGGTEELMRTLRGGISGLRGDIEDRASIIAAFAGMENQHAVGQGPVTCTDNTSEYPSVCKKTLTFVKWTGTEWELGDFGGKIINVGDIQNRVAIGNPRQG